MILGLLAAGEGSRLRAEGVTRSKGLVEVDGLPMVRRTIESFARTGITRVACIVNDEAGDLEEYLRTTDFPIPVELHVESTRSSLHSLVALADLLGSHADTHFFLSTVDAVYPHGELLSFVAAAGSHPKDDRGTIGVTTFVEDESPLWVDVDPQSQQIVAVGEDATRRTHVTGGVYHFPVTALPVARRLVEEGTERLRHFQRELVRSRFDIRAHEFSIVVDVDHRADIARAEEILRSASQSGEEG